MQKTVIYTAIFGGKDKLLEPKILLPQFDFICFTDDATLRSPIWKTRIVKPTNTDPVRAAKLYKILPHKYLAEYDYSIWIDGNIIVSGDVNELIEEYLTDKNIAFFDHANTIMDPRSSVYEEARSLIAMTEKGKFKDDPEIIRQQMDAYRAEGFPDTGGLVVGMEIVRRHHAPDVREAMEAWWQEIQSYSKRDQLSFNYIAWKTSLKFAYMKGDSRKNPYFLWKPHQR